MGTVTTMKFLLFLALFDALSCQMSIKINGDTYACTLEARGSEVPPMKIEISNAALKTSAKPEGDENIEIESEAEVEGGNEENIELTTAIAEDGENNEDLESKPTEKDGENNEDVEAKPAEEDGEKDKDPEAKPTEKDGEKDEDPEAKPTEEDDKKNKGSKAKISSKCRQGIICKGNQANNVLAIDSKNNEGLEAKPK